VSVAAEFEKTDIPNPWDVNHVLQLRLYRNGVRERLIATHHVTSEHSEPISMTGEGLIEAKEGDVLQVRVFTQRGGTGTYEVLLTGDGETNWVSFERIGD
jgi:hypothetical protein